MKGLKAGEMIVIDGQIRLHDGVPVTVLPDKPPPQAAAERQEAQLNRQDAKRYETRLNRQ